MKVRRLTKRSFSDTIRSFFALFIRPFMSTLHEESDEALTDGIRRFFNAESRSVYFAKAKVNFTIPGKEWLQGCPSVLGYSHLPRSVRRGKGLILRFDSTVPDKIEMQVDERVFVMSKLMWTEIEQHVEIIG